MDSDEEFLHIGGRTIQLSRIPEELFCSVCWNGNYGNLNWDCENCCGVGLDPIPLTEILGRG